MRLLIRHLVSPVSLILSTSCETNPRVRLLQCKVATMYNCGALKHDCISTRNRRLVVLYFKRYYRYMLEERVTLKVMEKNFFSFQIDVEVRIRHATIF